MKRAEEEERFHNTLVEAIKADELLVEESFLATTVIESRFILERVGAVSMLNALTI